MKRPSPIVSAAFLISGGTIAGAFFQLAQSGARIGSAQHLSLLAIAAAGYAAALLLLLFRQHFPSPRIFALCLALAFAARIPLAVKPAGAFADTHRYFWDARVQRAGINPYRVTADNPAYAWLHNRDTRRMNNADLPSPYPPGAQLFFRAMTAFGESLTAIKLALVACEAAIVWLLASWLRARGREPSWVLAYAWHPVAIFETASAGHLDALGTMFVVAALTALTRGRALAAALALAASITIKPLPLVLAALFVTRVRWTHALVGAAFIALLFVPFLDGWRVPSGALGAYVDRWRFNQLLFDPVARALGAQAAAVVAVAAGLVTAAWMRVRQMELQPAAWAWPMAAALLFAPVIYPWYLIWLLPFLIDRATLPLLVWTLSIIPTYTVWQLADDGARWAVPDAVLWLEYGATALSAAIVLATRGHATATKLVP